LYTNGGSSGVTWNTRVDWRTVGESVDRLSHGNQPAS